MKKIKHTFKVKPDQSFSSVADHVVCTNCGAQGLVAVCREDCPNCGAHGNLMWVDENNPEVVII